MAEDKQSQSHNSTSDSQIPPPTDPYITYQTPYPRNRSEEVQNPFIEFRRLADTAFSSFFAGLPRFLGTEKFKEANIRESDQEFVKSFDQQAKAFENRIVEMVRSKAEEAEGFRKQLEQEWEERRRENEKRMEEENKRWEMMRRGLEKCPGLRPDGPETKREADTELDLYNGLKAYEAASYKPRAEVENAQAKKCPWKDDSIDKKCPWNKDQSNRSSWLSGLGWDGRRRAKNIPLHVSAAHHTEFTREKNVEWQQYQDEEMNPFDDDDHVVPWLKLSPYSPLSLLNSQNWSETRSQATDHDVGPSLSDLPWDEAFEDLMAIHKTGQLPSLVRRLVYWGGPNQWMTDMVLRGSLGSRWEEGFMVASLMGAVDGHYWKGFDGLKDECKQLSGREFRKSTTATEQASSGHHDQADDEDKDEMRPEDWVQVVRAAFEPKVWEAYEQMEELAQSLFGENGSPGKAFGARGMVWPTPEEVINALSEGNTRTSSPETSDGKTPITDAEDVSAQKSWPSSSAPNWSRKLVNEDKTESLVSSFTTTTTRTLPDGSVETKRILKKRFADGTEENSEETDIKLPVSKKVTDAGTQTAVKSELAKEERKNGWFWN